MTFVFMAFMASLFCFFASILMFRDVARDPRLHGRDLEGHLFCMGLWVYASALATIFAAINMG